MSTLPGRFHLAQINIGRTVAPLDDPQLAGFVERLDEINDLAEQAPGFVWRLVGDNNNATDIQVFSDPLIILNMSVWESIDALFQYTYYTEHAVVFRQRRDWFEKFDRHYLALWWMPAGERPTAEEGRQRVEYLQTHGPTQHAFTFKQRFPVPEGPISLPKALSYDPPKIL